MIGLQGRRQLTAPSDLAALYPSRRRRRRRRRPANKGRKLAAARASESARRQSRWRGAVSQSASRPRSVCSSVTSSGLGAASTGCRLGSGRSMVDPQTGRARARLRLRGRRAWIVPRGQIQGIAGMKPPRAGPCDRVPSAVCCLMGGALPAGWVRRLVPRCASSCRRARLEFPDLFLSAAPPRGQSRAYQWWLRTKSRRRSPVTGGSCRQPAAAVTACTSSPIQHSSRATRALDNPAHVLPLIRPIFGQSSQ